jgi:hypothetical protein
MPAAPRGTAERQRLNISEMMCKSDKAARTKRRRGQCSQAAWCSTYVSCALGSSLWWRPKSLQRDTVAQTGLRPEDRKGTHLHRVSQSMVATARQRRIWRGQHQS